MADIGEIVLPASTIRYQLMQAIPYCTLNLPSTKVCCYLGLPSSNAHDGVMLGLSLDLASMHADPLGPSPLQLTRVGASMRLLGMATKVR